MLHSPSVRRPTIKKVLGTDAIYTDDHAEGAWPNGTPVIKINSESADAHPNGTLGVIIGSVGPFPFNGNLTYGYIVLFEGEVIPIGCIGTKLQQVVAVQATMTAQAPGAWPNGSIVLQAGRHGVIRGSIGPAPWLGRQAFGYFVEFEADAPLAACLDSELERLPEGALA